MSHFKKKTVDVSETALEIVKKIVIRRLYIYLFVYLIGITMLCFMGNDEEQMGKI